MLQVVDAMYNFMTKQIYEGYNRLQVLKNRYKYGLCNKGRNIEVLRIYDKTEWHKSSDFFMVCFDDKLELFCNKDGSFFNFNGMVPDDSFFTSITWKRGGKKWLRNVE